MAGSSTSFHRLKHSSDISVEFKDDKAGQEHTITIPSPHDLCNARPTTSISIHSKPYTCRCVLLRPMTVNTHLQQLIFTLGPRTQIHGGRHTVMPSFATILVISAGEIRSNNAPVDFSFFYTELMLGYDIQRLKRGSLPQDSTSLLRVLSSSTLHRLRDLFIFLRMMYDV